MKSDNLIHTFLAQLNSRNAILELSNVSSQLGRLAPDVGGVARLQLVVRAGRVDVQTRRETPVAGAREDHGPHVRVRRQLPEDLAQLQPHGLEEGVELGRPVDLHVGDEGGAGGGHVEVLVGCVSFELGLLLRHLGDLGGCYSGRWLR